MPQPLIAESDKGNSSKSADQAGFAQSGVLAVGGHMTVSATTVPAATASYDGGNLTIPGLLQATGMTTSAGAKLIPGQARTATADAAVGRLSLLGGVVVLDHLHWTADQRSGAGAAVHGAFTAGDVIVNGQTYPGSADQLATVFTAVNAALAPTGLHVTLPVAHKTANGIAVPPMSIGIGESALGAAIVNPVLTATQPVQEQIKNILFGISCKFGTIFTVEDIFLSAVDGTGGLDLLLGGANASSDGTAYANPFGNVSLGGSPALGSTSVPGATTSTVGGLPGAAPPPTSAGVGVRARRRSTAGRQQPGVRVVRDDEPCALAALQRRQCTRRGAARTGSSHGHRREATGSRPPSPPAPATRHLEARQLKP